MLLEKECPVCGKTFVYPHWRKNVKCCSKKCLGQTLRAENNMICPSCGKPFHLKQSHIRRFIGAQGFYCSKKCAKKGMRARMLGEGNHQYGLKGILNSSFKGQEVEDRNHNNIDIYVYSPNHPYCNKAGRVLKHRFLVEQNYFLFSPDWFVDINGTKYLKKSAVVHHKDGNHSNNSLDNLEVLTRGQHTAIHNKEFCNIIDPITGRIVGRKKPYEHSLNSDK